MDLDEREIVMGQWSPDWRGLFASIFYGASVTLSSDEGWLSLIGFPVIEVDGLWKKYGVHLFNGCCGSFRIFKRPCRGCFFRSCGEFHVTHSEE